MRRLSCSCALGHLSHRSNCTAGVRGARAPEISGRSEEFNPFENSKFGPFGHPNGPNKRLPYRAARCRPLFGSFKIQNSNFARGLKFSKGSKFERRTGVNFERSKFQHAHTGVRNTNFVTILYFAFRILHSCRHTQITLSLVHTVTSCYGCFTD